MNRNQLVGLLALLVVLGIAGWLVHNRNQAEYKSSSAGIGQKLLGDFPLNDVAHLSLKQGANELNLVKKDGLWRVRERNDYPANFSEISDFLIKVRDLKVAQSDKIGPSQLARFELAPGAGTNSPLVVDFKDASDKSIKSLLLGKKHTKKIDRPSPNPMMDMGDGGWPDGRWVKVGNDSDTVALISDALANIEPKPESWLNKDFFKIEKARSIAVAFPNATNSWKLTRDTETAEWKLADAKPGEQLDSSKTSGVANSINSFSFNDVAMGTTPDTIEKPTVATVETFDDFAYTLKTGSKTNDNYPLAVTVVAQLPKERTPGKDEKPEDKDKLDKEFKEKQKKLEEKLTQEKTYEKWVYLASAWPLDSLLKERSQLLQEKKEEPKKDDKSAVVTPEAPKLDDLTKDPTVPPPVAPPAPVKPK